MAAMAVPCLPVGERVQLLADYGERDVVEEKPRGVARSAAAPGTAGRTGRDRGQAEGAARRLTHMPRRVRHLDVYVMTTDKLIDSSMPGL